MPKRSGSRPRDVNSLAAALEELLLTPGLAEKLGARGRQAVVKKFSVTSMAAGFARVCEDVVRS